MIVDLREFERFPVTTILEAQPGEIQPFTDDVVEVNWVQLRLHIQRTEHEFYCSGAARAEVRMACSRCGREFTTELDGDIDFILKSDAIVTPRREESPDDEEYVYYHGNDQRADVTDQVRQALILAVGMKPLCQENCRGLCPKCGANWNETTCSCTQDEGDSRWDGLKKLLG